MRELQELLTAFREGEIDKATLIEDAYALYAILPQVAARLPFTRIESIELRDGEAVATLDDGMRLVVDPRDHRSIPLEILNWGDFEPVERGILMALVRPGDVFFDVGGHVGWYSMLATRHRPDVVAHCFEPVPATYLRLVRHLELNAAQRVMPYPIGFAEAEGRALFYFDPAMTGNASARNLSGRAGVSSVEVRLSTLDAFVAEHGLCLDVLKCDVEGGELGVLQGGIDVIRRCRPAMMFELLRKWSAPFGYHPNDVLELVRGLGYDVYVANEAGALVSFGQVDDETVATNYFFLHPARHQGVVERLGAPRRARTPR